MDFGEEELEVGVEVEGGEEGDQVEAGEAEGEAEGKGEEAGEEQDAPGAAAGDEADGGKRADDQAGAGEVAGHGGGVVGEREHLGGGFGHVLDRDLGRHVLDEGVGAGHDEVEECAGVEVEEAETWPVQCPAAGQVIEERQHGRRGDGGAQQTRDQKGRQRSD